jgi:hypothetical protein
LAFEEFALLFQFSFRGIVCCHIIHSIHSFSFIHLVIVYRTVQPSACIVQDQCNIVCMSLMMLDTEVWNEQVSQASRLRRLQRQHAVDLSAVTLTPSSTRASPASDMRQELVGFAAASALRSLKVPHIVEEASGVLVCDSEDINAWAHRRHIELRTRLQQRRRRRNEEANAFSSNSSDSEADSDHHAPHGMHVPRSDPHMSDDLNSGSLTPGLSGRAASHMKGSLNIHTAALRSSSLHAHHMMHSPPLPDVPSSHSMPYLNREVPVAIPGTAAAAAAPTHVDKGKLNHMHEGEGEIAAQVKSSSVSSIDDNMHAAHAPDLEERHVTSSGEE